MLTLILWNCSPNAASGVLVADFVDKKANALIKDRISFAKEEVVRNQELIASLGDVKVDVNKVVVVASSFIAAVVASSFIVAVVASSFIAAVKPGNVTMNIKGRKFTQNDVVIVVLTDLTGKKIVKKVTVNANGTIDFDIDSTGCTMSLIKF